MKTARTVVNVRATLQSSQNNKAKQFLANVGHSFLGFLYSVYNHLNKSHCATKEGCKHGMCYPKMTLLKALV